MIANQRPDRLALLADVVAGLGHEVIASEIHASEVGAVTARVRPDVALVGLGENGEHALKLISAVVAESFCPVIALLESYDGEWLEQAAARGIYAYIVDTRPEELQSALDITLRRYRDFLELRGAFERRDARAQQEVARQQAQQRLALELHDKVVQELAVARLALDLDSREASEGALARAVESAREVVTRSIEELTRQGVSLEDLIRGVASETP